MHLKPKTGELKKHQELISRNEQLPCSGVTAFSRTDSFLVHNSRESLYYHQSETKMADSSKDELSDSSGNLSVVSDEDFKSLVV